MKDFAGSLPSAEEIIRALGIHRARNSHSDLMPTVALFGAGILVGAGLALLFAPSSGEELRHQLTQTATDLGDQISSAVGAVQENGDRT